MMAEVPATPERISYVLAHLWERGREELEAHRVGPMEALARFAGYVASGPRSGCLEFDGEPVLVAGIARDAKGDAFTWFQATDAFDAHASAVTRYMRREVRSWDGPLAIYSVCVHPKTAAWFRVLGFGPGHRCGQLHGPGGPGMTLYRFDKETGKRWG